MCRGRCPSGQRGRAVNPLRKLQWFKSTPAHHASAAVAARRGGDARATRSDAHEGTVSHRARNAGAECRCGRDFPGVCARKSRKAWDEPWSVGPFYGTGSPVDGNRGRIAGGMGHANGRMCGCSLMVKLQPSKLITRVRFPSPAPSIKTTFRVIRIISCCGSDGRALPW